MPYTETVNRLPSSIPKAQKSEPNYIKFTTTHCKWPVDKNTFFFCLLTLHIIWFNFLYDQKYRRDGIDGEFFKHKTTRNRTIIASAAVQQCIRHTIWDNQYKLIALNDLIINISGNNCYAQVIKLFVRQTSSVCAVLLLLQVATHRCYKRIIWEINTLL